MRIRAYLIATLCSGVALCVFVALFRLLEAESHKHVRGSGEFDGFVSASPRGDLLCFSAAGEGGKALYLYNLRSKKVTQFTKTAAFESTPCFSPDGKSILYAAGGPDDRADHLFLRQVDHPSVVKQITRGRFNDSQPSFSRDGSKIAFVRYGTYDIAFQGPSWSDPDVYTVRSDGTSVRQVTLQGAAHAHFLSDNNTLIYSAEFEGRNQIYRIEKGALGNMRSPHVMPLPDTVYDVAVSPDRKTLVAFSESATSAKNLYLMDTNGENAHLLGRGNVQGMRPAFAHDGKSIFFLASKDEPEGDGRGPRYGLWQVDVAGQNARKIWSADMFDNPLYPYTPPTSIPANSSS